MLAFFIDIFTLRDIIRKIGNLSHDKHGRLVLLIYLTLIPDELK
jgi:hypothetical protein